MKVETMLWMLILVSLALAIVSRKYRKYGLFYRRIFRRDDRGGHRTRTKELNIDSSLVKRTCSAFETR